MREVIGNARAVMVPAGKYVLGDPCYVVPDDKWDQLLASCEYFQGGPIGKVDGHCVLGFGTKWGDGCYVDQYGFKYPVDAGLIGLVPIEFAQIQESPFFETRIIEFSAKETKCSCDEDGKLTFGAFVIDTNPSDDSEEE